jgi:hypothetical protein
MDKHKIYLETSMFSYYYEERTVDLYPEWKNQVHELFDLISAGEYEPYSSIYAMEEIDNESNETKKEKMKSLVKK